LYTSFCKKQTETENGIIMDMVPGKQRELNLDI